MRLIHSPRGDGRGHPSTADLAAIQREWPLIEAEMALVAAEARVLTAEPRPTDSDWRQLHTAERRVLREAAALVAARLTEALAA